MSATMGRTMLLLALLAGCGAEGWALLVPLVNGARAESPSGHEMRPVVRIERVIDTLLGPATRRPLFRRDRRASPMGYDPARLEAAQPSGPMQMVKPPLLVTGIAWARNPAAVVEGLPGIDGARVVREGESVAGIRVIRIARDRVLFRGLDTTWNLPVREPWK